MLTKQTFISIKTLYNKYQNDINLFSKDDLNILINYLMEHPLFLEIKNTKGYFIIKKIIYNLQIKEFQKGENVNKLNKNNNKSYIILFGDIKKRNYLKNIIKINSKKIIYCTYKCISNSFFAEIDKELYINYILLDSNILLNNFIKKINKYSFFKNLSYSQYKDLFLNYEEIIYYQNELIYNQGDDVDGIYLIIKGECKIFKKKEKLKI